MGDDLLALLKQADPDVSRILASERDRQETTLELIASENHVSNAVMHAAGSWMTNKYAEGYPASVITEAANFMIKLKISHAIAQRNSLVATLQMCSLTAERMPISLRLWQS